MVKIISKLVIFLLICDKTFQMIYIFLMIFLAGDRNAFQSIVEQPNFNNSSRLKPSIAANVTDISGHWEGTITRDEGGGKRTVYRMEMDVTQKAKEIKGISYVHFEDANDVHYHAKIAFIGKLNGSYFKYLETKIIAADVIPQTEWCVKRADLIFRIQNSKPTLEGLWEGITTQGECMPGRIFLEKKPPRA